MTPILRPDQLQVKHEIYSHWTNGVMNIVGIMPTGAGKTFMFSDIIREHNGLSVAIAHRQELVTQISVSLAKMEVYHRLIAPKNVIKSIINEHRTEVGHVYYNPQAPAAVAGVDTLVSRRDKLGTWPSQITLWIQDECFVAGTLVDGVPIEDIKVGDMVTGFDELTGEFGQYPVTRLFKRPAPDNMVRLQLWTHHVIYVTSEHPFWTQRGWINAGDLTANDEVLFNEAFNCDRSLFRVSDPICDGGVPKITVQEMPGNILQTGVFQDGSGQNVICDDGCNEPEVRVRKNEAQQPNEKRVIPTEDVRYIESDGSQTICTRRERFRSDRSRGDFDEVDVVCQQRPEVEPCGENREIDQDRLAEPLQDRCCNPIVKNSDRSRRCVPQFTSTSGVGQQKRPVFNWTRVASVEVHKSNHSDIPGNGFVYNIEVDNVHTYVANGVVVHNCHHVLKANKWGTAASLFPNARGLGVTATPSRADGKGLGRHSDGLFDSMVVGLTMRELIDMGHLTDYQIYCPPGDFSTEDMKTGANGDFTQDAMRKESRRSHIVGDVVNSYLQFARGKQGVTFTTDVETAHHIAKQYNDAGVRAEAVSAKTPDHVRNEFIRRFRNGALDQLVNVDLFGEGFDVPAIEVVSMARPTQSFGVYMQQFGRALRVLPGKTHGLIIDHVGNVKRHNLPDIPRIWTLDARSKRGKRAADPDALELTTCLACYQPYERCKPACPFCGFVPEPVGRSTPEQVDGDLELLDVDILNKMRQDAQAINESPESVGERVGHATGNPIAAKAGENRHREKQEAQASLRNTIANWAGVQRAAGRPDRESYRLFYLLFGIDVLSAQSLSRADTDKLRERIEL